MLPPVLLLAAAAACCGAAARLLARARWPARSPAAAIALWQALGLGFGLSSVGTLLALGAGRPGAGVLSTELAGAASAARGAGRLAAAAPAAGGPALPPELRLAALAAGTLLALLLCWMLLASALAVGRGRNRQRALLALLARGDPKVPGALVVDYPAAAAYCLPGLRSAIVLSSATLDLLRPAELAAVLAHERAHLRRRHDLVLLQFTALARAFGWSATAREACRAVALLVEMHADDRARRHRPARELATALLRFGAAGVMTAPAGTLAAAAATPGQPRGPSGDAIDGAVAARVTRLLRPAPGLRPGVLVLVGVAALLAVAVPAVALAVPL